MSMCRRSPRGRTVLALSIALCLACVVPLLAAPYSLGRTGTDPGSSLSGVLNRATVTGYTSVGLGTVTTGAAWYDSTTSSGSSAKLIILASSAGEPTTVLGVSTASVVPSGGGTVAFTFGTPVTIAATTLYFIGLVHDAGGGEIGVLSGASGSGQTRNANGTFSYASPPGSWPGTDFSEDYELLDVSVTVSDASGPCLLTLLGVGRCS